MVASGAEDIERTDESGYVGVRAIREVTSKHQHVVSRPGLRERRLFLLIFQPSHKIGEETVMG